MKHVLNKLFQQVFVITTGLPNERYTHFYNYLKDQNINFDIRVAVDKNFFETRYDGTHEINRSEQSLSSQYASIFYECYYTNVDSFVVIEDDNVFCQDFEDQFNIFFNNVPSDWDVLHLGDYLLDQNIKKEKINNYVDKIYIKYTTNCMIFRNKENFIKIAECAIRSKYQIDFVLNSLYNNKEINCYAPNRSLTNQLSYRVGVDSENKFKSLIR
jgi:hypothetical protein